MNKPVTQKIISRLIVLVAGVFLVGPLSAQPNPDASMLFARSSISGTARSMGAGGAFSSVGGDLGGMNLNPAGLGLCTSSDISITPGLQVGADQSMYNGSNASSTHPSFDFAQAGMVWTKKIGSRKNGPSSSRLKSLSFAFNFTTDNSFSRNQSISYTNTNHSLIDNYVTLANEGNVLPDVNLFTYGGIIGTSTSGVYSSNVRAPVNQIGNLNTRGGIYDVSLGMGANVDDKLFFGFSLGVPILSYSVNTIMYEGYAGNGGTDSLTQFQSYQLNSTISESGVGVTGKVGLIYKPASWARFGVSYALPTWYFVGENYEGDLIYQFASTGGNEVTGASSSPLDYTLRAPMKGTAGASFFLKELGFISVDYEFQNLGSMNYNFTDPGNSVNNAPYNQYIKSTYGLSHTLRAGLEGCIGKLRLRAGYSYSNSPFKKDQNYASIPSYNQARQSATFGIGGVFKRFYIDAAYVLSFTKDALSPNSLTPLDEIDSRYMTHTAVLTLGFKIGNTDKNSSKSEPKKRSSDQLPRYIDPGDKY